MKSEESVTSTLQAENDVRKWFVMSAYRQEKKAEAALLAKNMRCFVPKRYTVRTLQGRKIRTLQPVVANLVFVYASWNEIILTKQSLEYLQFQTRIIQHKRQVMIVPDAEMEQFIRVAEQWEADVCYYRPEELGATGGERVRIVGGTFNGVEGRLMKITGKRNKRVVIQLEGVLAVAITVENPEYLEILK